jgi:hypothetical protein
MWAIDMDLSMVLEDLPMALITLMAGLALESFETPDPFMYADAYEAQSKLSEVLGFKLAMRVLEQVRSVAGTRGANYRIAQNG